MKQSVKQGIRLRGISDEIKGRAWESDTLLRAGRLGSLEIVLEDSSVSRRHAEVKLQNGMGWVVRDLESTNGTFVNGQKLGAGDRPVKSRDIVQFGKVALMVESAETGVPDAKDVRDETIDNVRIEVATNSSWEDAIQDLIYDRNRELRPGQQLLALLRAGHHLVHIEKEDELLHSILNDATAVLAAQRGAIVLQADDGKLKLRALSNGLGDAPQGRFHFSQKLAQRCFNKAESILCSSVNDDPELAAAQSIADGQMASVLCVLLRTPRKNLGVLHLDRTLWQKPFTEEDLHLADALAANVSAGIECAMLLKKKDDLFQNTITVLAEAVDMKDKFTGGHTRRVTELAVRLGLQLGLTPEEIKLLERGTPLHDIGKIGIKDSILLKPGKLTTEEFEEMKLHTTKGAAIVSMIPDLHPIIPIVKSHHERWDGRGYPEGLKGEAIPRLARIVAVVDAYDAMTSPRPYHPEMKGRPPEVAFAEIEKHSELQFDPTCARAFLAIKEAAIEVTQAEHQTALVTDAVRVKRA
ncbi:MAG: HD domain-containing protein [Gemmataceae bacterium]